MKELTPLMRQYWEIKNLHEDKILLFRMGDFYEMFFQDAITAAPLLGITLTSRNKKSLDETPMCGVPHHSIAGPINKLLAFGYKVALCEQTEDPKLAKGLVKRAVTRILTPGMVLDPETLETSSAHYLACFEEGVLAAVDVSTGESFYYKDLSEQEVKRLLSMLPIAELVTDQEQNLNKVIERPTKSFWANFENFDHPLLINSLQLKAPARLLSYLFSLSQDSCQLILKPFEHRTLKGRMALSSATVRHLEIFQTYKGEQLGSFFHCVNRTQTSVGARLLRQWLLFPLRDHSEIALRQDKIASWISRSTDLLRVREVLRSMGDLERRLSKIGQPSANARDLLSLRDAIRAGVTALEIAGQQDGAHQLLLNLSQKIDQTLVSDPPLLVKSGGLIRAGFSIELDEIVELATNSQAHLEQMELSERQATGISSLKIRYNNVFGYYIEVTNTHKDKVPSHYMRKQTLSQAERFCTEELISLEKKVLAAQSRRNDLEYEIYEQLKKEALASSQELLTLSHQAAELDVLTSFAWLAIEKRLQKPKFNTDMTLNILGSRHLVVEDSQQGQFVANDLKIQSGGCLLLTGPNMAGKSTLMRQVALTALMAQVGCFVPADQAELPLYDQIFTRIGASDQLSEGLSTFMVEMTETAEILKKMTRNSLVIFDEIGRGTSTFDGMSLAQSILEHLLTEQKAMSLFATHYHELTTLEQKFSQLINAHMSVNEKAGEIRFLYTLARGPALKSYGIQVAKLAGLPVAVTKRAGEILKGLEFKAVGSTDQLSLFQVASESASIDSEPAQIAPEIHQVAEDVRNWPVQTKTPIEALVQISKWQEIISSASSGLNH